jgi:hypothetical protein
LEPTRDEFLPLSNGTTLRQRAPGFDAGALREGSGVPVTERPAQGEAQPLSELNRFDEAFWGNDRQTPGRRALKDDYRFKYSNIMVAGNINPKLNAAYARQIGFWKWVDMIRNEGDWNYKAKDYMKEGVRNGLYSQEQLAKFGNFNIGYTAAALGIDLQIPSLWGRWISISHRSRQSTPVSTGGRSYPSSFGEDGRSR